MTPSSQLEQALNLQNLGNLDEAATLYQQILEQDPRNVPALANLATLRRRQKQPELAIALLQQAIALQPDNAPLHFNLGNLLNSQRQSAAAETAFRTALACDPTLTAVLLNLGNLLRDNNRNQEAVEVLERFVQANPDQVKGLASLGRALANLDRFKEAYALLRKAYDLAQRDYRNDARFLNVLGVVAQANGHFAESEAYLRRTIALEPSFAEAQSNLGALLNKIGREPEAIPFLENALRYNPDFSMAHANLAYAFSKVNRHADGVRHGQRAVQLEETLAMAHLNLATVLVGQGRLHESQASFRRGLELEPDNHSSRSSYLFSLTYDDLTSDEELFAAHVAYGQRHIGKAATQWANDRSTQRRLRIGYVSGDLLEHPVGMLIEPILTHHDRTKFESFCYSCGIKSDAATTRIRQLSDHWNEAALWDLETFADRIRADQIDILFDLGGHTANNRLPLFALKPAPVQISYAGYVATTGLQAMDYYLLDTITANPDAQRWYSEKLLRLPCCLYCYQPPSHSPPVAPAPCASTGVITFGSFNNLPKLTTFTLQLWAALLRAMPNARLLLKSAPFYDERTCALFRNRFASCGGNLNQLELILPTPFHEHLKDYGKIDIALDPFPFNGGITTLQALWQGVPTISLMGTRHVSRVGASILQTVALNDLVAQTPESYLEKALALAQNPQRIINLRASLRATMAQSTLINGQAFIQHWENALRQAWERYANPT